MSLLYELVVCSDFKLHPIPKSNHDYPICYREFKVSCSQRIPIKEIVVRLPKSIKLPHVRDYSRQQSHSPLLLLFIFVFFILIIG